MHAIRLAATLTTFVCFPHALAPRMRHSRSIRSWNAAANRGMKGCVGGGIGIRGKTELYHRRFKRKRATEVMKLRLEPSI